MRVLAIIFVALILALQYPMWLGKGGWLQVRELGRQIDRQRGVNAELKARNDELEAEVRDLKQGFDAIEERARNELGMVKRDEVFFMLQENPQSPPERAAEVAAPFGTPVRAGPGAVPAEPGGAPAAAAAKAGPVQAGTSPRSAAAAFETAGVRPITPIGGR